MCQPKCVLQCQSQVVSCICLDKMLDLYTTIKWIFVQCHFNTPKQRLHYCYCIYKCTVLCHGAACLFTNCRPRGFIDCVVLCLALSRKSSASDVDREDLDWVKTAAVFPFTFFLSAYDMEIPQEEWHKVAKWLLAFFGNAAEINRHFPTCHTCVLIYCVYAGNDKWERTHISPLRTWRSFLPGNGFTSVPSSPSIRPRTESIAF